MLAILISHKKYANEPPYQYKHELNLYLSIKYCFPHKSDSVILFHVLSFSPRQPKILALLLHHGF